MSLKPLSACRLIHAFIFSPRKCDIVLLFTLYKLSTLAKSTDPDQRLQMRHLIRVFTVYKQNVLFKLE